MPFAIPLTNFHRVTAHRHASYLSPAPQGEVLSPEAFRLVVQVVPQLEVWDLAVLFGAVRPESDLSSEAVRLAALVSAVVSLVSM
jgi:hypothetical protein